MDVKHLIAAMTVCAAVNGMFVEHSNMPSTKTRAERDQAYSNGHIACSSEFVEHTRVASTRRRSEVRGEAVQAAHQAVRPVHFGG